MVNVAVHAAVGQKAHQVQGRAIRFAVLHGGEQGGIFEEPAVLDILGDLDQHLIDHAARADVGVSDLGIAHLTVRQTHVQAGGFQLAEGILGKEVIQLGGGSGLGSGSFGGGYFGLACLGGGFNLLGCGGGFLFFGQIVELFHQFRACEHSLFEVV